MTITAIPRHVRSSAVAALFAVCLAAAACGEDGDGKAVDTERAGGPLYAIANEIYGANEDSTTYISVLSSLDIKEIDYSKAREYAGGRATLATVGGWLFVTAPESPIITRFKVSDQGVLTEDGQLSLLNFGIKSVPLDDWGNTFISPTKAYLLNYEEGNTLIWNPSTMEIIGEIKSPELAKEEELSLDGSPAVVRGDRLYRTFYWTDWKSYTFSSEQYLAVYDIVNDKLLELIPESRCPALGNRVEKDEQGNLYFSNWIWNVGATLVKGAPRSCVLRMSAGASKMDPDWTLPYGSVAMDREGAMFAYLGNRKGIISVFHKERVMFDASSDPQDLAATPNWKLWSVDLDRNTGAPLEGIDWMTGAASTFHLDGRDFVFVPGKDWAITKVYELEGGQARPAFDVRGWSYSFVKLR